MSPPIITGTELLIAIVSLAMLAGYHGWLALTVRRTHLKTAIGMTKHVREKWIEAIIKDQKDIVGIQTLRNQVMAATFLASTAILISLGILGVAFRPSVFRCI